MDGTFILGQIASVWDLSKGVGMELYLCNDIVVRFLTLIVNFYEKGSYLGNLDIGLAITGAKGIRVYPSDIMFTHQRDLRTYPENVYKHTTRKSLHGIKKKIL
ncbi:MAG: hypothetical protein IPL28_27270 [Chloroflexi bacterium]|nr:hypothetical protein [Chloroflexota bacterium]